MPMEMNVNAEAECDGCGCIEVLDIFELATDDETEAWKCDFELPSGWTGLKDECFCNDCSSERNNGGDGEEDDDGSYSIIRDYVERYRRS